MEKQIVNIFLLLGFNYLMIKSWGTRKVTLLTVIWQLFLNQYFNRIVFWFT